MRGKLYVALTRPYQKRNIPAYAGKTVAYRPFRCRLREHPRVCGENALVIPYVGLPCGTSPRMRGKPQQLLEQHSYFRNIPAYAGKTGGNDLDRQIFEEHPRVCGENLELAGAQAWVIGTSPRMRGKRQGCG